MPPSTENKESAEPSRFERLALERSGGAAFSGFRRDDGGGGSFGGAFGGRRDEAPQGGGFRRDDGGGFRRDDGGGSAFGGGFRRDDGGGGGAFGGGFRRDDGPPGGGFRRDDGGSSAFGSLARTREGDERPERGGAFGGGFRRDGDERPERGGAPFSAPPRGGESSEGSGGGAYTNSRLGAGRGFMSGDARPSGDAPSHFSDAGPFGGSGGMRTGSRGMSSDTSYSAFKSGSGDARAGKFSAGAMHSTSAPAVGKALKIGDMLGSKSASSGASAPAPAAAPEPTRDTNEVAAVSKAASLDISMAKRTLAVAVQKKLQEMQGGMYGIGAKALDRVADALVKSISKNDDLAVETVRLVALHAAETEAAGDRKTLAQLLLALRGGPRGISVASIGTGLTAAIETAAAAPTDGGAPGVYDEASTAKAAIMVRHFVEELTKAGASAKPVLADLPAAVKAFLAAGPTALERPKMTEEDLKKLSLDDSPAEWGADDTAGAAALASKAVAPAAIVTAATASAQAARKAAAAAPALPSAAPTRPAADVSEELLATGKQGEALLASAIEAFAHYAPRDAVSALLTSALKAAAASNEIISSAPFLQQTRCGAALAHYAYNSIDSAVALLYALQHYHTNVGLPKGILPNIFMQLYQCDIVKEEAFNAWREDTQNRISGKDKALAATIKFFAYLEDDEEEDEDEDEGVQEALKGVIKPNNSSKLR